MITPEQRDQILRFNTCKIANALEKLEIRLRNEGFTHPGFGCVTGGFPLALGYAVTGRVKAADPPLKGSLHPVFPQWWSRIAAHPGPSIAVIQDIDERPGQGAVLSGVHAEILRALNCQALITNGAVRDLPALAAMGFPAFSQTVTASHSYVHMVDFDVPVEVLGLHVRPGDLVFADVHGAILLPEDSIGDIIRVANEEAAHERIIIDLCRSDHFSLEKLAPLLQQNRDQS